MAKIKVDGSYDFQVSRAPEDRATAKSALKYFDKSFHITQSTVKISSESQSLRFVRAMSFMKSI